MYVKDTQIEDTLWKAEWALNNINEHLEIIRKRSSDPQINWNLAQALANLEHVQRDVQSARTDLCMRIPAWKQFIRSLKKK